MGRKEVWHGHARIAQAKHEGVWSCPLAQGGHAKILEKNFGLQSGPRGGRVDSLLRRTSQFGSFCGVFRLYFGWEFCSGYFGPFCRLERNFVQRLNLGF